MQRITMRQISVGNISSSTFNLNLQLIHRRIGIHLEHTFLEESLVLVGDGYLSQLYCKVFLECSLVLWSVVLRHTVAAFKHIQSNIVVREETVVGMNTLVDIFGNDAEDVGLGSVFGNRCQEIVDTWCAMIMDSSLIAHDAGLHAQHIVCLGLLPSLHVALQLKFLRLEPVAGVVFITDSHRHDMALLQSFSHRTFASHSHHLYDRFLGAVVTVLSSSLTLGNPDVVVLFVDYKVHVFSHSATVDKHLSYACATLYDERFVYSHDVFNPRRCKQVVANGNLACCLESRVDEHYVEQCRVEHDVAMITYEGVSTTNVDGRDVDVTSLARLRQKILEERIAERYLELKVGLALHKLCSQCFERNLWEYLAHNCLKLLVGNQSAIHFRQFLRLVRPDAVILLWYLHSNS